MVSRPRLSVIMPTHSRVDVIGFAIESVLRQTVSDFELLVIGDGCAPGTEEGVLAFNDPRIRFLDLPKAPYFGYANRNLALREARGRFIGFAADDDLLFPDHFELLIEQLEAGCVLAYSQALWISTDGIAATFLTNLTFADEMATFLHRGNSIAASCFIYRADSLPHLDVWPEDIPSAADWHLWRRIIRENDESHIFYCRTPTVLHFSARRKNSRHSAVHQLGTLLDIADRADWWPAPLRVSIPQGKTEQEVYAGLMRAEPMGWSARVREAATDLTARLAWYDVQTVRPALAKVKAQLLSAQISAETAEREILVHRNALQAALAENERLRQEIRAAFKER